MASQVKMLKYLQAQMIPRVLVSLLIVLIGVGGLKGQPSDLFVGDTVRLNEGALVEIWQTVTDQFFQDDIRVKSCFEHKTEDCAVVFQLMKVVEEARQYRGKTMLGHLNRAINLMIKPGLGNWTNALDTIELGAGDCKGYSIAKYFALLQAGVSADNVRLAIVYNQRRSATHMVVAVRQDETWSILDNLTMLILSDFEQKTYLPMFVLDYTGVRGYL
jgi:predicted transglutaminase-like cysteine proteinase